MDQDDLVTFDPATAGAWSEGGAEDKYFDVYGALLMQEGNNVVPLLAKSITSPDKGATWILTLSPNMVFSDGTPFNAAAVVYNWRRIENPATKSAWIGTFIDVASFAATSPTTVTIKLKSPNTLFPSTMTGVMSYIASPTAIQKEGQNFGTEPVGGGPFTLKSWAQGSEAVFVKNPKYVFASQVHLSEVIVRPVASETQKLNAFSTNEAQLVWTGQIPTINQARADGGTITTIPLAGNIGMMYNTAKPPFNDTAIMVAFAQAMDRNQIAKTVWDNADNAPAGLVSSNSPIFDPRAAYPTPNLAAAQQTTNTYTAAHGPIKVSILYSTGNQEILDSATLLQAQLQRLKGVTVQLSAVDQAALVSAWIGGSWTMTFNALDGVSGEPGMYNLFDSKSLANFGHFSNPAVDAGIKEAESATTAAGVQAGWNAAEEAVCATGYMIPLENSGYFLISNSSVHNLQYYNDGVPRTDLIWVS